jgi:FkbM family methyltransferase
LLGLAAAYATEDCREVVDVICKEFCSSALGAGEREVLHMDLLKRIEFLIEIIKVVRNWPSLLLFYAGLRQNVVIVFRNNITVKIADRSKTKIAYYLIKISLNSRALFKFNSSYRIILGNSEEVFSLTDEFSIYRAYVLSYLYRKLNTRFYANFCEFYFRGEKIIYFFDSEDFTSIANLCITFVDEQYGALNVKEKIVADIGASFGDTSIYFALKGAKKVYAYEPVPWVVELLEKNVRQNNLSEIVNIHPCAVSVIKGKSRLTIPKTATDAASLHYGFAKTDVVEISVQTVTPPMDAEVVKLNCEGCEYDIILKWLNSKIYDEIIINYHEDYEQLVKKLAKLGYKVKIQEDAHMLRAC